MLSVTRATNGKVADRYPVSLDCFNSVSDCIIGVMNAAYRHFDNVKLSRKSPFSMGMLPLKRITYNLPLSDLYRLAATGRFFAESLSDQLHTYRMICNAQATGQFFKTLALLKEKEYFPIQQLVLDPDYKMNDVDLLAVKEHLPLLEQFAVPDVREIASKTMRLLRDSKISRMDVLTEDEEQQKTIVKALESIDGIYAQTGREIYVHGKRSEATVRRIVNIFDDRLGTLISAYCCLSTIALIALFIAKNKTNNSNELTVINTMLIVTLVVCCIFPCFGCVMVQLKKHRSRQELTPLIMK